MNQDREETIAAFAQYEASGDCQAALSYCETALAAAISEHGADSPEAAEVYMCMGDLYEQCCMPDKAAEAFYKACRIRRETLDASHPDLLLSLCRLRYILKNHAEFCGHEKFRQQLTDHIYGHLCMDIDDVRYALILAYLGYYPEAAAVCKRCLGDENPVLAKILLLSAAYRHQLDMEDDGAGFVWAHSTEDAAQALALCRKFYGERHPLTAKAWLTLGDAQSCLLQTASYFRALEIQKCCFAMDCPVLADTCCRLGDAMATRKETMGNALAYYLNALSSVSDRANKEFIYRKLRNHYWRIANTYDMPNEEQAVIISHPKVPYLKDLADLEAARICDLAAYRAQTPAVSFEWEEFPADTNVKEHNWDAVEALLHTDADDGDAEMDLSDMDDDWSADFDMDEDDWSMDEDDWSADDTAEKLPEQDIPKDYIPNADLLDAEEREMLWVLPDLPTAEWEEASILMRIYAEIANCCEAVGYHTYDALQYRYAAVELAIRCGRTNGRERFYKEQFTHLAKLYAAKADDIFAEETDAVLAEKYRQLAENC